MKSGDFGREKKYYCREREEELGGDKIEILDLSDYFFISHVP